MKLWQGSDIDVVVKEVDMEVIVVVDNCPEVDDICVVVVVIVGEGEEESGGCQSTKNPIKKAPPIRNESSMANPTKILYL